MPIFKEVDGLVKIKIQKEIPTFLSTYNEFLTYKTQCGLAPKTLTTYQKHFKVFCNLSDVQSPIESVNFDILFGQINSLNVAQSSKASYLRVLKTYINWLNKQYGFSFNTPKIKVPNTYKDTYTNEELALLVKTPSRTCTFCEYRSWCIILLLIDTGMRAGSLREIRNSDLNLNNNTVILRHVKTGIVQVLPFSSTTSNALRKYISYRRGAEDDYLFCDQYGKKLSENGLILAVKRFNKSRGVERHSIHLFRHTFAKKYLLDCGGNAFTLQKMLGHSTLNMTQHYCNIYSDELIKSYSSPLETVMRTRIKRT